MSTVPGPLSDASVSISAGLFGSKCVSWTELAIAFLTSSNSSYMSLVLTKWLSFFKRLHIRYAFLERLGMKADMKFTVPRELWSSCLPLGADKLSIAFTFFGQGDKPSGQMFISNYSMLHFLI